MACQLEYQKEKSIVFKKNPPVVGICPICGEEKKLVNDHEHGKTVLRGKICRACNVGLGMFRDSVEFLRRAINYLSQTENILAETEKRC
jgi:hypothetical protein